MTLLLRLSQSSAMSQSKQRTTRRAWLREISIETFRDVDSHPKEYRFHDTLEQFCNGEKHYSGGGVTISEEDNIEKISSFNKCGGPLEVSPVANASHSYECTMRVSETSKLSDSHIGENLSVSWMEAIDNLAIRREREDEASRKIFQLSGSASTVVEEPVKETDHQEIPQ